MNVLIPQNRIISLRTPLELTTSSLFKSAFQKQLLTLKGPKSLTILCDRSDLSLAEIMFLGDSVKELTSAYQSCLVKKVLTLIPELMLVSNQISLTFSSFTKVLKFIGTTDIVFLFLLSLLTYATQVKRGFGSEKVSFIFIESRICTRYLICLWWVLVFCTGLILNRL